eukprot:m.369900 g.369900  ORF g.369900 m.369900 type:complete len:317 (+) comp20857_c0_seq5:148-1098(+)
MSDNLSHHDVTYHSNMHYVQSESSGVTGFTNSNRSREPADLNHTPLTSALAQTQDAVVTLDIDTPPTNRGRRRPRGNIVSNVNEDILFVIDLSAEMAGKTTNKKNGTRPDEQLNILQMLKSAIRSFVLTKSRMNPHHSFGVACLTQSVIWLLKFTRDIQEIEDMLSGLEPHKSEYGVIDIDELLAEISRNVSIKELDAPDKVVHVVLITGRSSLPTFTDAHSHAPLVDSVGFFLDIIRVYPYQSKAKSTLAAEEYQNQLQEKFVNPHFYIFSIPADARAVLPALCGLLSHPLQRADRTAISHTLASTRAVAGEAGS